MNLIPVPGLPLTFANALGKIYSLRRGKLREFTQHTDACGYRKLRVHGKNRFAHRLIAAAFLGECPDGLQVNHKDGDKANNCPYNLEYVTRSQNLQHAHDTGLMRTHFGEKSRLAKLTDEQAAEIRAEYLARVVNGRLPRGVRAEIAARYGVDPQYPRLLGLGLVRPDRSPA
jgi:hypothetical protein